jgi:hypothetical protein
MFAERKYSFCMLRSATLFFLVLISLPSFSQVILRDSLNINGLGGKKISAQIHSNIFNDFLWTEPNYTAKKIEFSNNIYYFEMNGASFQLTLIDTNLIELKGFGTSILIDKVFSKSTHYFDKNMLGYSYVQKQKWVAHPTISSKVIPVKHYTQNKIDYYTTFEPHTLMSTQWKWEIANDSVLLIPSFLKYQFDMNDGRTIFVYENKDINGKTNYYIQNASYLYASDTNGIEYILIDNNCNGNYTDAEDRIFFKTWNPHSKQSTFKKLSFVKENTWINNSFFHDNFLIPYFHAGKLNFENIIENYSGSNKSGTLQLLKVPKKSSLIINTKSYAIKKGKNKFDCNYGIYHASISNKGFLDFDTIFTINDNNPSEEIMYQKTLPAGTLKIKNIFENDFIITIRNANGYIKNYLNTDVIAVPIGNNELSIYINGIQINYSFSINQNNIIDFDFEAAIQKSIH